MAVEDATSGREPLQLALAACKTLLAEARASPVDESDLWTVEELEQLVETLTVVVEGRNGGPARMNGRP